MKVLPAFVDETGVLTTRIREQPVFGIGLLIVNDPGKVTDSFYKLHFDLASQKSWHREYKFSKIARHNLPQYIELLNLYFSFPCFEFHALLVDRTEPSFNLSRWGRNAWEAYISLGRNLLERRLKRPVFAIVDFQSPPKNSSVLVENEFCSVSEVTGCIRASSDSQVFLQVVDVLLGCVQADWRDSNGLYPQSSSRADARRSLVRHMKTSLGVPTDEPMVTYQRPLWETDISSPFTVSLYR